jgi:hypothetical protein
VETSAIYRSVFDGLKLKLQSPGTPFPNTNQIEYTFDALGDNAPIEQLKRWGHRRSSSGIHTPFLFIIYYGAPIDPDVRGDADQQEDAQFGIMFATTGTGDSILFGTGSPNWGAFAIQKFIINVLNPVASTPTRNIPSGTGRAWHNVRSDFIRPIPVEEDDLIIEEITVRVTYHHDMRS